jgi:hypothetical protein
MSSSLGAPIDPAYTAFLDGLKRVAELPVGKSLDRWHPKDAGWYPYDPKVWGQEISTLPPLRRMGRSAGRSRAWVTINGNCRNSRYLASSLG